uniref:Transporter n=1 Tax=Roseihalotalea indica TaxID=2867963 RepID=A0AA49GIV4_9BACT|nr:transporter [Tunicatimonas sp. TK19036]
MTDLEYDVMDELYFVTPFNQLRSTLELEEQELRNILQSLLQKNWIKCYVDHTEEILPHEVDFTHHYQEYFYLATKEGLLAHNGR